MRSFLQQRNPRGFVLAALAVLLVFFHVGVSSAQPLVIGGANFTEQSILANIYAAALRDQGVEVSLRLNLGNREIIIPALASGELDIVPEYLGSLLGYYDTQSSFTTVDAILAALKSRLPDSLVLLDPAPANSTTTWVVTAATAERYHLRTLSDLARVADQLVVGGPPELPTRSLGLPGLYAVYGIRFREVRSLDMGGPLVQMALRSGAIDVATMVSNQGILSKEDWVVLADDRNQQPRQNVTPLVRKEILRPQIASVLNAVSARLSTDELKALNRQVDLERKDPARVAAEWVRVHVPVGDATHKLAPP